MKLENVLKTYIKNYFILLYILLFYYFNIYFYYNSFSNINLYSFIIEKFIINKKSILFLGNLYKLIN